MARTKTKQTGKEDKVEKAVKQSKADKKTEKAVKQSKAEKKARKSRAQKSNMKKLKWDQLDNTAQLFPVIAREGMTNVYRVSVVLNEDIQADLLQKAVEKVLPYFDVFKCTMKRGFFWYYFEENLSPIPRILEEHQYPCLFMDPQTNNRYMFRVSYYKNRINLEVFHALSDGNGALNFLKEITYQYLRYSHEELAAISQDKLDISTSLDSSDSYLQNYTHKEKKTYETQKAVEIKGDKLPDNKLAVIHGIVPVDQIKKVSKEYGVTINQYIVAAYAWAIYKSYLRGQPSAEPIITSVPVNLRPFFGSDTNRNFFVVVSALFKPEKKDYTFDEVVEITKESLQKQINKENLEKLFSYNVSNQQNLLLRSIPLSIKKIAINQVYLASAKASTTTVTNLGSISVSETYRDYIDRFQAILSMSYKQNIKITVLSYMNKMAITFSSNIIDTDIQKTFFRKLAEDGIEVTIDTNGVYYE